MVCKAIFVALVIATPVAHAASLRSSTFSADQLRPEIVAKTLASVEDEWKQQAVVFSQCDATKAENCKDTPGAFAKSCATVISAVVQGSGGNRAVAKEYMATVCNQKVLLGWHKLRCADLGTAIVEHAMTADSLHNRENLKTTKLCSSFWSTFVDEERKREAVEAKEKVEREAKEAKELVERKKKEAEEAAVAKKKAEAEAKAEAERHAQEEAAAAKKKAEAEAKEKEQKAKKEVEEAKVRAAEAGARLAQKKAEAEAVQKAAQEKLAEAALAEKEHLKAQEEHKKAQERLRISTHTKEAEPAKKVNATESLENSIVSAVKPTVKAAVAALKPAAEAKEPLVKATTPVVKAVAPASKVAKPEVKKAGNAKMSQATEKADVKAKTAALLEQDPCAGCTTGLAQSYQTCASKHGNPCAETNAAGIVGSGPGKKKDIGCCMKKEKHDRCVSCSSMDCAHGTCNVNKKYYNTYAMKEKFDDKTAMKKAGWGK